MPDCVQYDSWISDNEAKVPDDEMRTRHTQHGLYRKVLEVYRSDVEWERLAHAQRVERNKTAHEVSLKAKELGPPPVSQASVMCCFYLGVFECAYDCASE